MHQQVLTMIAVWLKHHGPLITSHQFEEGLLEYALTKNFGKTLEKRWCWKTSTFGVFAFGVFGKTLMFLRKCLSNTNILVFVCQLSLPNTYSYNIATHYVWGILQCDWLNYPPYISLYTVGSKTKMVVQNLTGNCEQGNSKLFVFCSYYANKTHRKYALYSCFEVWKCFFKA